MTRKQRDFLAVRGTKRSLNRRILKNTMLNILILVIICCVIMALSLQSLANNILLDSLKPMARQSAKTVEANVHMLADRMMTIAADSRINAVPVSNEIEEFPPNPAALSESRRGLLEEAAEIYEFYTIGLYDLNGRLLQGTGSAPEELDSGFFTLLKETDNLTINSSYNIVTVKGTAASRVFCRLKAEAVE